MTLQRDDGTEMPVGSHLPSRRKVAEQQLATADEEFRKAAEKLEESTIALVAEIVRESYPDAIAIQTESSPADEIGGEDSLHLYAVFSSEGPLAVQGTDGWSAEDDALADEAWEYLGTLIFLDHDGYQNRTDIKLPR
jgi:hypothetical protein